MWTEEWLPKSSAKFRRCTIQGLSSGAQRRSLRQGQKEVPSNLRGVTVVNKTPVVVVHNNMNRREWVGNEQSPKATVTRRFTVSRGHNGEDPRRARPQALKTPARKSAKTKLGERAATTRGAQHVDVAESRAAHTWLTAGTRTHVLTRRSRRADNRSKRSRPRTTCCARGPSPLRDLSSR